MYLNREIFCSIAQDSVLFAGTKFALHKIADSSYFMNVNATDIIGLILSDGIYYIFLKNFSVGFFKGYDMYKSFVEKYVTLMVGVSVFDLVLGNSKRIVSNLISIGLSGGVNSGIMYFMNGKMDNSKAVIVT